MSKMKIIGIILLCLQAFAIFGGIVNGSIIGMFTSGFMGIFELIGFCLPAIIGLILIVKANKKAKK